MYLVLIEHFIFPASSLPNVWALSFATDQHSASSVYIGKRKLCTMSDNYVMLDEPGMFSFPSTRPTTPGQSSGPSYGPVQVLTDDTQHPRPASGRLPSRGGSRSHTPNAELLDLDILPNNQGFPVDSVCAVTRPLVVPLEATYCVRNLEWYH